MKKICIALDTSPSAEKIATLGYEYAKALKAEVVLVHAVNDAALYAMDYDPIMGYNGFLIQNNIEFVEGLEVEAGKFLEATAKFLGEPDLQTKVLDGEADYEILEFIKEWEADLLVIGTHSHNVLENVLMGNTAVKLVRHSKILLLVVPVKE
ncbi:universal stress protein [Bizionia arctica]|uniref:Universal stress protein n=1 Tax=Bizionia arctica TaxID=1495645 RepID=A0A917LPZ3_9FLAO|nr:universal stress protein [Bizionia arctica]GGG49145.1 universal stress protein A [Bizionia arctica]